MAIVVRKRKWGQVIIGGHSVSTLYRGAVKIFEAVRSCFAGKRWRYNRPWLYKDKWKY